MWRRRGKGGEDVFVTGKSELRKKGERIAAIGTFLEAEAIHRTWMQKITKLREPRRGEKQYSEVMAVNKNLHYGHVFEGG